MGLPASVPFPAPPLGGATPFQPSAPVSQSQGPGRRAISSRSRSSGGGSAERRTGGSAFEPRGGGGVNTAVSPKQNFGPVLSGSAGVGTGSNQGGFSPISPTPLPALGPTIMQNPAQFGPQIAPIQAPNLGSIPTPFPFNPLGAKLGLGGF